MAVKSGPGAGLFLLRLLGITGGVAALLGAVLWFGLQNVEVGSVVTYAGLAALALTILCEIPSLLGAVSTKKGGFGLNVVVQIALAVVLLVGANVFSYLHFQRFDWTKEQIFTLPQEIRDQLSRLRSDTEIVVFQQYVSFGQRAENKQDKYDLAAQKKIIEKVRDLAEQFQDLGPRFRVQVLDIQDEEYQKKFDKIKADAPELAEAIEKAPENSIFFHTREPKRVQRLSFSDIYQLDKEKSMAANEGAGNLVLNYQGPNTFARKVFNIEEKKPRVAFGVVHEWLGQEGREEYGMPGLRKILASRGFEGRDVILKYKWPRPEATVLDHQENRFEILEAQKGSLNRILGQQAESLDELAKLKKFWKSTPLAEINKQYVLVETIQGILPVDIEQLQRIRQQTGRIPPARKVSEAYREEYAKLVEEEHEELDGILKKNREKLAKISEEQSSLRVEDLAEQKRITDLRAKFNRLLADCDMLVIPRPTLFDIVVRDERIPNRAFTLDEAQQEGIKDFIKSGKPVLFCLGPANEPEDGPPDFSGADPLEKMLESLGLTLTKQTILFDVEAEAMADKGERTLMVGAAVDVPPAELDWVSTSASARLLSGDGQKASSPIRTSLKLTAKSFGKSAPSDFRIRHPRPVYVMTTAYPTDAVASALAMVSSGNLSSALPSVALLNSRGTKKIDEKTVFLMTGADAWNEDNPFPSEKKTPQYERAKPDDPNKGTVQEERRGPFPIGVAWEATVPRAWFGDESPAELPKVRLAVVGHGGVFIGDRLSPMKEKLFLDVSNWLVGRDDLLGQNYQTWEFPRVSLADNEKALWQWGAWIGLPTLFIYLGLIVWLIRRTR